MNKKTVSIGSNLLDPVIKIAYEAGHILMEGQNKIKEGNTSFKTENPNDILTEYDLLTEKFITSKLIAEFPDHSLIGEESHDDSTSASLKDDYVWIIDPIDGTLNFSLGRKEFTISIGLFKKGEPFAGVIYAPARNEMYYAEKNRGSFLNGQKINCVSKSLTDTPMHHVQLHKVDVDSLISDVIQFSAQVKRYGGSAALDLSMVANGEIDTQLTTSLKIWDIAAAIVIVQEAGGAVLSTDGKTLSFEDDIPFYSVMAGHKNLLEDLLSKLPRKTVSNIPFGK